ncbi:MAG: four helix bundle protein [Parcubacteria group bacterium]|jgi:four helix bundle protein
MTNQVQDLKSKKYDLIERSACFGENIIDFLKTLSNNTTTRPLISQLIRSATSIGANYMEADCADSKKDFRHRIVICKKEAKETLHWLRMIARAEQNQKEKCRKFYKEAHELVLIFSAILKRK